METNQPQEITKKIAIQRTSKIILGTIIFVLLGSYLKYGKIPSAVFFILIVFIPIVMIIPAILGFKYRHKINNPKSKFWYIYMSIGILMILINLTTLFVEKTGTVNYIDIIIGMAIILYSIKVKNKQKKL